MAAYGAISIFKTTEKEEKMHTTFLEAVTQELHKQGLSSTILHPFNVIEPQTSFFASPNEQVRFYSWLATNHIEDSFNTALRQKALLPQGIALSDFEDFLGLPNVYDIINYILDGSNSSIAAYAVKEDLLTTKESKKDWASGYIHSFCECFNLDLDTFVDYQRLSRLPSEEAKVSLTGNLGEASYNKLDPQKPAILRGEQLKKFQACQTVLRELRDTTEERIRLDREIAEFCKEYNISVDIINQRAKELPQEEDPSTELGLLNRTARLLKISLEIAAKIKDYDYETAVKTMKAFQFIRKYEFMLNDLRGIFKIGDKQAREIITICGHGLTEPYFIGMSHDQYEKFVTKEANAFSKIKDEVYYRVAEKGIAALKLKPFEPPLIRIKSYLQYIVTIIELASYDCGFFSGEKIDYSFRGQDQEKYIPPLVYSYYMKLKELIQKADLAKNLNDYLKDLNQEIIHFQILLTNEPIYGQWHNQFLTDLYKAANPPEAVAASSQSSTMRNPSTQSQSSSSSSSSSVSFQSEDHRRRDISGESSGEIRSNDLPQNAEVRPATPGRTSP
jgi:hypothetical protein